MSGRKRDAVVGIGSRSRLSTNALLASTGIKESSSAFCDVNAARMRWHNDGFERDFGCAPVASFQPDGFARMPTEQKVDVVIVTSVDRTHDRYVFADADYRDGVLAVLPGIAANLVFLNGQPSTSEGS